MNMPSPQIDLIADAIRNLQVLTVTYDGITRAVEPHAVGLSSAGKDLLRCFQPTGGHVNPNHDWDLMSLSKIVGLAKTGATFAGPRPGYKRGDSAMVRIYAEL